jgi:WD40 repeat protein
MRNSASSSFLLNSSSIINSESSYYDVDYRSGRGSLEIRYSPPDNFNIKYEIYKRIKQYQQAKFYIMEKTKSYLQQVELACKEKISELNKHIKDYQYLLTNMSILNEIGSQHLVFNLSKKKLETIYYSFKEPFEFYKNEFFIEKFRIPNTLHEAKGFVFTLFPWIKENLQSIMDITISPNGLYTVIGRADDKVKIYNNESLQLYHQFADLHSTVLAVAISNDCQFVMAGLVDRNIFLWNLNKKKTLKIFRFNLMQIKKVLFTNDSEYLAFIGENQDAKVVEVRVQNDYNSMFYPNGEWLDLHPEVEF